MYAERTLVTFRNDNFNTMETKSYYINPCNYGDDAARWLAGELETLGAHIERDGEFPGQEDFGWFFTFSLRETRCDLLLGAYPDANDNFGWMAWFERHCGFFAGLVGGSKKIPPEAVELLHTALSRSKDVREIRWYRRYDFDGRREAGYTEQP